ncbi:MAG: Tyrosine-specific transport protein [Chlamydiae bacterium]|nr:Tyrosine-specific transport protein [Chlamydiota bacterium]
MSLFNPKSRVAGGALLIAGTTIGVGMLALPIATGPGGFLPSITVYLACWAFMLCTGLLLLEVCSWMPPDSNLISMAGRYLGKTGKILCWFIYLFLFEAVMIAHIAGGGAITSGILSGGLGLVPSMIFYTILFSPIVYLGTRIVDRINVLMFSGVMISYLFFIIVSYKYVDFQKLTHQDWSKAWIAIPILFTAFTFQVIVPTLVTYMKGNYKQVRKSILIGTSIPLVVYIIWQVLILGIIPIEGANGLLDAASRGETAVAPLKHFVGSQAVVGIGKAFAFFTMTASYIALSLAFLDFLADGLKVKKVGLRKGVLCLAVFIPPMIISMYNPDIFLNALKYAGGISCAILFGVYPPLMVWIGRYKKGHTTGQQIRGGRLFLSILILFIVLELVLEVIPEIFGW